MIENTCSDWCAVVRVGELILIGEGAYFEAVRCSGLQRAVAERTPRVADFSSDGDDFSGGVLKRIILLDGLAVQSFGTTITTKLIHLISVKVSRL